MDIGTTPLRVPTSLRNGRVEKLLFVFSYAFCLPCTSLKAPQSLGGVFGLSEGGPLPSDVGGVSSTVAASVFVPSIAVPSRQPRSGSLISTDLQSLSLSRPHLANDEDHGYACLESMRH